MASVLSCSLLLNLALSVSLTRLLLVRHILLVGEVARLETLLALATYVRRSTLTSADVFDHKRLLIAAIGDHGDTVADLLLMRLTMEIVIRSLH